MSALLTLPRLGETMEAGRVVTWAKRPGEAFRRGETLVEIESDKTVVELPALSAGRLIEILVPEGTDVAVGDALCRYEADEGAATAPPQAPPIPQVAPAAASAIPAPGRAETSRRRATPLARRLARQHGIALDSLTGTGRRGRIDARDVLAALSSPSPTPPSLAAPGGGEDQGEVEAAANRKPSRPPHPTLSSLKERGAGLSEAPPPCAAFAATVALAPITALRERLGGVPLAVEDFFIKATARALRTLPDRFPAVSIGWRGAAGEGVLHDADRLALGSVAARRQNAPAGSAALALTWIGRPGVRPAAAALAPDQRVRLLVAAGEGDAEAQCLLAYRADALDDNEAADLLGQIRDAVQDPLGLLL